MPTLKLRSLAALLVPLSLLAGCDDARTTPVPVDGGAPDALERHLTLWVVEPGDAPDQTPRPIANAAVAFAAPGTNTPVELTTGADGSLVVSGDFTKGAATVSAYAPDHRALTFVDVTPENVAKLPPTRGFARPNDLVFLLNSKLPRTGPVKLSGALTGKLEPTNLVTLSTTAAPDYFQNRKLTYSLPVGKDQPFSIIGIEWRPLVVGTDGVYESTFLHWFQIDQPALSADLTLDIDVSAQTPLTPRNGTVRNTMPGGANNLFGPASVSYVEVLAASGAFLGAPQKIGPNADGTAFEGDLQWVLPASVPASSVSYTSYVMSADRLKVSTVVRQGVPPEALVVDNLPLLPVTTSQSAQTGSKIAFTSAFATTQGGECAVAVQDKQQLWHWTLASAAANATTLTVPALSPALQQALPKVLLTGLIACTHYDADGGFQQALGAPFDFTP
jgi:hypothetical protein